MMIAGAVSSLSKIEGMMLVTEGERSDYAQKYHKPSIEVFKYKITHNPAGKEIDAHKLKQY